MDFILIILFTEHLIVFVKVFLSEFIGDVPVWVQKRLISVNSKNEELNLMYKEIEMDNKFQKLNKQINIKNNSFATVLNKMQS